MKMSLLKRILAGATAVICAFTVSACMKSTSPMETLEDAAEKNIESLAKSEALSTSKKLTDGGSIELRANLSEILTLATGYPLDIDASVKFYTDIEDDKLTGALTAEVGTGGETLLDLITYLGKNHIAVKSENLLGETAYGMSFENFRENLNNSIFGPDGEFPLTDELYEAIDSLAEVNINPAKAENLEDAFEDFINEIKPQIYKSLETNGDAKLAKGTVTIKGEEFKTTDVVMNFTVEDYLATVKDILTAVKSATNLKPLISSVCEVLPYYEDILILYGYSDIMKSTPDELYGEILTTIDEFLAEIAEDEARIDEITNNPVSIVAHIVNKTGELAEINMTVASPEENITADLTVALPTSISPDFTFKLENYEGDSLVETTGISYAVTENSADKFTAELTTQSLKMASIEWDKVSGEYSAILYNFVGAADSMAEESEPAITLSGKYTRDAASETLTFGTISMNDETLDLGEIAVIITYSDPAPVISDFTDLLKITADEFTALGERIVNNIYALVE